MYDVSVPYTKSTYDNGVTPACVQSPPGYQFKLARSSVAGYTGVQWVAAKSATALMQVKSCRTHAAILQVLQEVGKIHAPCVHTHVHICTAAWSLQQRVRRIT